ncbi:MAG: glycosyltransferase family 39 protein [Verrucomicrobiota bacterium]|nr:glycosyltransferase family 39 protein [Verrucomicrobiota bacterium]
MRALAFDRRWAVLAIVLLTVVTRLPSLLHPQPIDDEDVYSVVGNVIADGGRPYVDAVERKPPLLFWTYAAITKVAGEYNWKALHAIALAWTLATMAGLYVIGKNLFSRDAGLIAALLYSIFQPWAEFRNLACNGELLMNLPLVWAWAIGLRRSSSRSRPELFVAGALLCVGFLLKQPAAIAAVPLGIYLLLPAYRASRKLSWLQSLLQAALLTAGFFATLGGVALVLQEQGILREAFFWTITGHAVPHVFWTKGVLHTLAFVGACMPLLIGAIMASRRAQSEIWREKTAERSALVGLLAASIIGTASGARFYPHYYIQLIPPLALLAAPFFSRLWAGKIEASSWLLRPRITYAWLALTVVGFSISHWLGLAPLRATSETGRYLREHSAPNERIFVWGQAPRIYCEAQRPPACRYVVTFPLTGYVFGWSAESIPDIDTHEWIVPGSWAALAADFAAHPPAYVVDVQVPAKNAHYPVRDFPVLAKLLTEHYQPVARTAEGVIYQRWTSR